MPKYVFVTGGVTSSLGKGITAASIGRILKARGIPVSILKLDPYINIDPGTMSPYQHGEVFVTDDGAETDLDLGHYERFTGVSSRQSDNITTGRIYRLKRDLLSLKRAVSPLVDVCNRLMRYDINLVPEDTRPYFRDVYDHVVRINEMIDALRELLTTALEANLSLISVSQTEHTKRLAAWAAIIAVPTMIAGVYGMNFDYMPELHWRYGYPVIMSVTVALCVGIHRTMKRNGWL